jgi:hypothetical protein
LPEFSDAAAADPVLREFRQRVRVVPDGQLDKMAAVINGHRRDASRPLDDARMEAKLRELAGTRADAWLRFVYSLESTARASPPD